MSKHPLDFDTWKSMESYQESTIQDLIFDFMNYIIDILEENEIRFAISHNELIEKYTRLLYEKLISLDISYYILEYGYNTREVSIEINDTTDIIYTDTPDQYNYHLRGPTVNLRPISAHEYRKYTDSDPFYLPPFHRRKEKIAYKNKFLPQMIAASKKYARIYGITEDPERRVENWDNHVINHVKNPEKTVKTCIFCRDEYEYYIYKWKTEIDPQLYEVYYQSKLIEDKLGTPVLSLLDSDFLSRFLFYNMKDRYILYDLDASEIEDMYESQENKDAEKKKTGVVADIDEDDV